MLRFTGVRRFTVGRLAIFALTREFMMIFVRAVSPASLCLPAFVPLLAVAAIAGSERLHAPAARRRRPSWRCRRRRWPAIR